MALDHSIPTTKHYREHIYFVFKLGEPALLGSKKIAYEYENFEISLAYEKWN